MFQMAEKMNKESNQEDEFGQVVAERPMLPLEDGNRYEAKLEESGDWEIIERRSDQMKHNDDNTGNVEDRFKRLVVVGQEDQQKEQNNLKVGNQDHSPVSPNELVKSRRATETDFGGYLINEQSSNINITTMNELANMMLNDRTFNNMPIMNEPLRITETVQQRQNYSEFIIHGSHSDANWMINNVYPTLPTSLGELTPILKPQQCLPMQEYHEIDTNPNHVLYSSDASSKSIIISKLLKMTPPNVQCMEFLSSHLSDLPTWSDLVDNWKSQKADSPAKAIPIAITDVTQETDNTVSRFQVNLDDKPAPTINTFARPSFLRKPPPLYSSEMTMTMWANAVDKNTLANHPIVKVALERRVVVKPAKRTLEDRMYNWFGSELNMDIKYDYINSDADKFDDDNDDDDNDDDDDDEADPDEANPDEADPDDANPGESDDANADDAEERFDDIMPLNFGDMGDHF